MPDGKVQWFDAKRGEARIIHSNRQYPTQASEIEPVARRAGARVHFDIERTNGIERAVRVRLRAGTRTSHLQRRFGDLTGASRADTKGAAPFVRPHPELGLALQRHPVQVAERWAALIASGDLEEAVLLYAPDAVLRTDGEVLIGPGRIRGYLGASPLLGSGQVPEVRSDDGTVNLRWGQPDRNQPVAESHLTIDHGEIRDQWIGSYWIIPPEPEREATPVHVVIGEGVGEADRDYAAAKVAKMLHFVEDPVLFALVRLYEAGDPARERPAIVEATIDVNGQPLRAHVASHSMREAVDLLERRIRDKLEQLSAHRRALRRRGPESGEGSWRRGDLPTLRPPFFDRPPEERQLVRHKTFAVDELTAEEALEDLQMLDYDFYLFQDVSSGQDAVVYCDPDGQHGLRQRAPVLSLAEAIERLDVGNEPFVFFTEDASGRGRVLYHRYDGHYGLIVPADEPQ